MFGSAKREIVVEPRTATKCWRRRDSLLAGKFPGRSRRYCFPGGGVQCRKRGASAVNIRGLHPMATKRGNYTVAPESWRKRGGDRLSGVLGVLLRLKKLILHSKVGPYYSNSSKYVLQYASMQI